VGQPAFLIENLFSTIQFPTHTVTPNEEAADHEAWRVATGRRSAFDSWKPTTTNQDAYIEVDCGVNQSPDMAASDRGHNLQGATVRVRYSDNGTSWSDAFTATVPSSVSTGSDLDAANGILTPEGAWLKRFSGAGAHRYWRYHVNAMGAGLLPEIVGLWLGAHWVPGYLEFPFEDDTYQGTGEVTTLPSGWQGRGAIGRQRAGSFHVRLDTEATYDTGAAVQVRDGFFLGRPMWLVFDDEKAERALLAVWARQREGFGLGRGGWSWRSGTISWLEWEPEMAA
jgi:hypothetical protein